MAADQEVDLLVGEGRRGVQVSKQLELAIKQQVGIGEVGFDVEVEVPAAALVVAARPK